MPAGEDPHPLLAKLGARIRSRRVELNMSQERLAELAQLHRTYIPGIEKGTRNITVVALLAIAKALGTSAEDLLTGLNVGARRPSRPRTITATSAQRASPTKTDGSTIRRREPQK